MKSILLVSHSEDYTSDYVIKKFPEIDFFRLNTDLIDNYMINIDADKIKITNRISNKDIISTECHATYYRRFMMPGFKDYEWEYREALSKEFQCFIEGIVEVFTSKVLSKPSILTKADNKVVQLQLAKKFDLNIPSSLITNNVEQASKFIGGKDEYIVKPLAVGQAIKDNHIEIVQTNKVDQNIELSDLSENPTYFQQYIKKSYELRITIVGEEIFPVKIVSVDKVDWRRFDNTIEYETIDIPMPLQHKCLNIMNELQLKYAAFDFIFDGSEYYFLELNANGQWLWLEEILSLDISTSIIKYLLEGEIY